MVRRTTLDVDDELLSAAQEALSTRGLKDTVDAAFTEAIRRARREALIRRIETGDGVERSPAMLDATRPTR